MEKIIGEHEYKGNFIDHFKRFIGHQLEIPFGHSLGEDYGVVLLDDILKIFVHAKRKIHKFFNWTPAKRLLQIFIVLKKYF